MPEFVVVNAHRIEISRDDLLKNSMKQLLGAPHNSLRKGVWVEYEHEAGRGDGVLRDWLQLLAQMIVGSAEMPFQMAGEDSACDYSRIYPRIGMSLLFTWFGRMDEIHEVPGLS